MSLLSPRNRLIASLLLAAVGLSLFFSGGFRTSALGFVGTWLFVFAVWFLVDGAQRIPRSEAELDIAPGEWQAWVGLAFMTAVLAAMLQKASLFVPQIPVPENPGAGSAARSIGTLFVAWIVLAQVLKLRWKGAVQQDERDRRIQQIASDWGRGATALCVAGIAFMLGFSPTARLQQFSYPFLAQMLFFALLWGAWFDQAIAALLYWRDRRAVSP